MDVCEANMNVRICGSHSIPITTRYLVI